MMIEEEKDTKQDQEQQQSSSSASAVSPPQLLLPKPTRQEVQNCQFSAWYSTFRNLSKSSNNFHTNTTTSSSSTTSSAAAAPEAAPSYKNATKYRKNLTIESYIISPLPIEFIDYLKCSGSVRLPLCALNVSSCLKADFDRLDVEDGGGGDGEWDDDDDDNSNDQDEVKQYNFPELTQQIQAALQSLSSSSTATTANSSNNNHNNTNIITGCIPKLNWSSPKDATWINCGTLQCKTPGDVYLLLKSSEFVMFDLENAWVDLDDVDDEKEGEEDVKTDDVEKAGGEVDVEKEQDNNRPPPNFEYELVLRKWCNLHPSMEFRCFIYDHELVAISQRHPTKFYSHLQLSEEDYNNDEIHPTTLIIHSFYKTYIQHRFAHGDISRYVMDVYVDSQERTWIVDFNVWGTRTDSLLFDWDELMKIGH
ncbi:hypothetical protein ACHAWC_001079, partial [Mediolabrus comicus]